MTERQLAIDTRARELLIQSADPAKAGPMASYMKSEMPFYGVSSRERKVISRLLAKEFPVTSRANYAHAVRTLWHGEFREEKYLAIAYARLFPRYVTLSSIPIYKTMIAQGAWWDFVDEIAAHLVGSVLLSQRDRLTPTMESWAMSNDLWLARASIICQLRHKAETDTMLLETACTRNLESTEFFIRKAIGWALREYARTDPAWVIAYVERHGNEMSGLTYREAMKHLR
jgi:3-methyladenine DNA glycosylase AlkD